jgi:putative tryptophan/tyrosine transport system substrate-binding protein
MNQRRLLVLALGAGLAGRAALLRAQASSGSMRRVGVLAPSTRAKDEVTLKPFFDQMRQLGWIEGQNIAYDRAYADDQQQALPGLAAGMAVRKPDLIFAPPTVAALAARQATSTIPIVFADVVDPVGVGLVAGLAQPGGNVTGLSSAFESIMLKRLELLREMLPAAKRIGLAGDANDPTTGLNQAAVATLASARGVQVIVANASNPVEFDASISRLLDEHVDAIFVAGSVIALNLIGRLMELANPRRVPVIGGNPVSAQAGALFSYGAPLSHRLQRSALLVDKVLKGAKPADLPVEQPTLFELVINLKTAKALGITVPRSILLRADGVIE